MNHGRLDAPAFNCRSYGFGLKEGVADTVCIVERWSRWEDLEALLSAKVVPALPLYNQLPKRPFVQPCAATGIANFPISRAQSPAGEFLRDLAWRGSAAIGLV